MKFSGKYNMLIISQAARGSPPAEIRLGEKLWKEIVLKAERDLSSRASALRWEWAISGCFRQEYLH